VPATGRCPDIMDKTALDLTKNGIRDNLMEIQTYLENFDPIKSSI
jgi:hypothetical protein